MNDSSRLRRHRATTRLPTRDYTRSGYYFVTICTKHRIPWFGEIHDGQMRLSDIGKITAQCWHAIPIHFPYIRLDAYVVMPDHVHGILKMGKRTPFDCGIISTTCVGACNLHAPTRMADTIPKGINVETLDTIKPIRRPQSGSLGSIINQFKRACTYQIKYDGHPDFAWQRGYHDRIIRDNDALEQIRCYIRTNPSRKGEQEGFE